MPFQTQQELNAMKARDPKQALEYIEAAKAQGKPVVGKNNPGYGDAAKRRLMAQSKKRISSNKGESDHEYRD